MGKPGKRRDSPVASSGESSGFRAMLPSFLSGLGISEDDSIQVSYSGGVAECIIRTPDGRVITQRAFAQGSFKEFTEFDARGMDREEKRQLARTLRKRGKLTQTQIARQLGVSQATVSNYLRDDDKEA